jgi:hypothetical protein
MTSCSGQEYHVGDFVFSADFDSGNLGGVSLDEEEEGEEEATAASRDLSPTLRPSTSTLQVRKIALLSEKLGSWFLFQ